MPPAWLNTCACWTAIALVNPARGDSLNRTWALLFAIPLALLLTGLRIRIPRRAP